MTTTPTRTGDHPSGTRGPTILTDTPRAFLRRARFWLAAAIVVAVIVALLIAQGGREIGGGPLSADSPAPAGSGAVVEVLRNNGIRVTVADDLDAARSAISADPRSTLLLFDPQLFLDDERLGRLAATAGRLVVVEPGLSTLRVLAPEIGVAGSPVDDDDLEADCDLPAARAASSIPADGTTYRVIDEGVDAPGAVDITPCFASGDDAFSVIRVESQARAVTILGSRAVLANESITTGGRAALALGLLGETDSVVWYLPTAADVVASGPPSLGRLTPGWVTPVMALLLLTAIAAAIWRGRRLGPLVIEDLPVVVRASETTEGRARLYSAGGLRLRAIDAVRIMTISRLSARLALPSTSTVDEVADAVAERLGDDPRHLLAVLRDDVPANDSELVALSDALQLLESRLTASIAPDRPQPAADARDSGTPARPSTPPTDPTSNRKPTT